MTYCKECAKLYGIHSEAATDAGEVICELCAYNKPCESAYIFIPDIISRLQGKIDYHGSKIKFWLLKLAYRF